MSAEILEEHLSVAVSDTIEESLMTKDKEAASECEEKRIKELRRIEKVLLEEKKQLEMLEKEQVMKMETEETSINTEAESNSSPVNNSKVNSPIRIKISLNNPETKSGPTSTSSLASGTSSAISSSSNKATKTEGIKINLGELVRNSKSKRSSTESSTSPVLL